jgi:hypothetical protein
MYVKEVVQEISLERDGRDYAAEIDGGGNAKLAPTQSPTRLDRQSDNVLTDNMIAHRTAGLGKKHSGDRCVCATAVARHRMRWGQPELCQTGRFAVLPD